MVPPAPIPEVFDPLTRFTQALWPGIPVTPVMENGASDSIYFAQAGIPCYGYSAIALERDDDARPRQGRAPARRFLLEVAGLFLLVCESTGRRVNARCPAAQDQLCIRAALTVVNAAKQGGL